MLSELNISRSTDCSLGSRKPEITEKVYQVAPEGLCAHKGGSLGSEGKGRQGAQYSHGLQRGSAWTAVALVAVGVLHRPIQLFPDGAG